MSAKWRPLTISPIPGVDQTASAIGDAASTLATILHTVAQLLKSMAVISNDALAAAMAAIEAILQEILDMISDLMNTGVYFYFDKGQFFSTRKGDGLPGMMSRWEASFDDLGDAQRPQFSGTADVSAMIVAVGANDFPSFAPLFALLANLFGVPKLQLEFKSADGELTLAENIASGLPTPPDWRSKRLGEVLPPFADLADILKVAKGLLSVAKTYGGLLQDLAAVVEAKATTLAAIADEIKRIGDAIKALINSSGLFILRVDAKGLPALIDAAKNADAKPPWTAEALTSCVCLLGGTANFGPVAELLS